jgi:polar amino acid transport system substrate-binding protein
VLCAGLVACGGGDDGPRSAASRCGATELPLLHRGSLTIGTDAPAFEPWFVDDDPANGKGFEGALARALAHELGLAADQVDWVTVPFTEAIGPGDKPFDFVINHVLINDERDEQVDFSRPYYEVNQALLGYPDATARGAITLDGVRALRLGAQVGSPSLAFVSTVVRPLTAPVVLTDPAGVRAALEAHLVDAVVVDLPTAFYLSSTGIDGTKVIGQFPATATAGLDADGFGLVFEEGSELRACVDRALEALRRDGTLDHLRQEWLSDVVDAPVIPTG